MIYNIENAKTEIIRINDELSALRITPDEGYTIFIATENIYVDGFMQIPSDKVDVILPNVELVETSSIVIPEDEPEQEFDYEAGYNELLEVLNNDA